MQFREVRAEHKQRELKKRPLRRMSMMRARTKILLNDSEDIIDGIQT